MTGSLQIKNNKYFMVVNTYEKGKRKPKWIATGLPAKDNKRKAEKMLREKLAELELKSGQLNSDVLLCDYVRSWLEKTKIRIDTVTYQGYANTVNGHILPYFADTGIKVRDVKISLVQEYMDAKQENGRLDGKGGLSPKTLRHHKNILYQVLNEAVRDQLLLTNPCQLVRLPQKEQREASYYNAGQIHQLLEVAKGDPLCDAIYITALYGLRRSELLGLKWDSIDFTQNTMTIRHTVTKLTSLVEKDKTKNKSSHRSFPLTDDARRIFQQIKAKEEANRKLLGRAYIQNDYVFKWDDGHPFSPDYISHHFADLLKKNVLPHIRWHELRHSCASMLINAGCPLKDVQEWMGHADIRMTADLYGHLDVARKLGVAEKINGSLSNGC